MDQYRWWLLGGFALVLTGGAVYISTRSKTPATAPAHRSAAALPLSGTAAKSDTLLDALKEELFRLELDHQQGRVTDQQYAAAKAALDRTLARIVKPNS
jgi:hypothetical protein